MDAKTKEEEDRIKTGWKEQRAIKERNLNEDQWEDRKQWSLGVGQRRKNVLNPIYTNIQTE